MAEDAGAGDTKVAVPVCEDAAGAAAAFQTLLNADIGQPGGFVSAKMKYLSMEERANKGAEEGELTGVAGLEYGGVGGFDWFS